MTRPRLTSRGRHLVEFLVIVAGSAVCTAAFYGILLWGLESRG